MKKFTCFFGVLLLAQSARAALTPPVPQSHPVLAPPSDAQPLQQELQVRVRLTIDASGDVVRVELLDSASGPYAEAVLDNATRLHFTPALDDGVPVVATVVLTQSFAPSQAAMPTKQPLAVLRGAVIERGTRRPVAGAVVQIDGGPQGTVTSVSNALGFFSIELPVGTAEVHVAAASYKPFVVHEILHADEALQVRYLIDRTNYDEYETVVVGKRDTTDVSRTTLSGRELHTIPGTFGDPFRVITSMPGVSTMFSLLGYPIVRGTSPGSTALLIDGVPMPELFHLLAGPSVIHPEFIDHIDFYPGTYPLRYGGYVGGVVDGVTRRAGPEEKRIDLDVDLLQAGGMVRWPLPGGMTGTVAGRYGYPGALLQAIHAPIDLEYWDYQARLDGSLAGGHFKIFAFGAGDNLTTTNEQLSNVAYKTKFHRLNLGFQHAVGDVSGDYSVYLGIDNTTAGGVIENLRQLTIAPYLRWKWRINDAVRLHWGIDGQAADYAGYVSLNGSTLQNRLYIVGGYVEVPLFLTQALTVTLGGRADAYSNSDTTATDLEPRAELRARVAQTDAGDAFVKAGVGRFHQPPRYIVPLPGVQQLKLAQGLEAAWQGMIGAEVPIAAGIDVDVQAYYNFTDPIILDLASNTDPGASGASSSGQAINSATLFGSLQTPQVGRSYGLEVILRQRDLGQAFGWISYTLSRTERRHDHAWVPWDYDRTHMLQAVAGMSLPRNWQFGARLGLESGRPISVDDGYNNARSPGFARFDVRIDKRAIYNDWMFDFYIDIVNVTLTPEFIDQASIDPRYILPTIGVRAVL